MRWRYALVFLPLAIVLIAFAGVAVYEAGAFLSGVVSTNAQAGIASWREDWGVPIAGAAALIMYLPFDRALDARLRQLEPILSQPGWTTRVLRTVSEVCVGLGAVGLGLAVVLGISKDCYFCASLLGMLGWLLIAAGFGLAWVTGRSRRERT